MGTIQDGVANQGHTFDVALDADDVLTVAMDGVIDWVKGLTWGVIIADGAGASVAVDHSLLPEGDRWTPAPSSPYTKSREGRETARFQRIRFTATGGPARVTMLVPGRATAEIA